MVVHLITPAVNVLLANPVRTPAQPALHLLPVLPDIPPKPSVQHNAAILAIPV